MSVDAWRSGDIHMSGDTRRGGDTDMSVDTRRDDDTDASVDARRDDDTDTSVDARRGDYTDASVASRVWGARCRAPACRRWPTSCWRSVGTTRPACAGGWTARRPSATSRPAAPRSSRRCSSPRAFSGAPRSDPLISGTGSVSLAGGWTSCSVPDWLRSRGPCY